jgi:hypothetical protein
LREFWLRPALCGTTGGLKQAPGALYIGGGKEGATKIGLDDAKAVLSELEADGLAAQARYRSGTRLVQICTRPRRPPARTVPTSGSTSGFAARMLGVPG